MDNLRGSHPVLFSTLLSMLQQKSDVLVDLVALPSKSHRSATIKRRESSLPSWTKILALDAWLIVHQTLRMSRKRCEPKELISLLIFGWSSSCLVQLIDPTIAKMKALREPEDYHLKDSMVLLLQDNTELLHRNMVPRRSSMVPLHNNMALLLDNMDDPHKVVQDIPLKEVKAMLGTNGLVRV